MFKIHSPTYFYATRPYTLSYKEKFHNLSAALFYLPIFRATYYEVDPKTFLRERISTRPTKTDIIKTVVKVALIATIILPILACILNDRIEKRTFDLFQTEYLALNREDRKDLIKNLFSNFRSDLNGLLEESSSKVHRSLTFSYYLAHQCPFLNRTVVDLIKTVEPDLKSLLSEINDGSTYACVIGAAREVKESEFKAIYDLMNEDSRIKVFDNLIYQAINRNKVRQSVSNPLESLINLIKLEENPEQVIKKWRSKGIIKGYEEIIKNLLKKEDYQTFLFFYKNLSAKEQKKQIKVYFKEPSPVRTQLLEITKAAFEYPDIYLKYLKASGEVLVPDSPNYNFLNLFTKMEESFYSSDEYPWKFSPNDEEVRFIKELSLTSILKVEESIHLKELLRIWDINSRSEEDLFEAFAQLKQFDKVIVKNILSFLTEGKLIALYKKDPEIDRLFKFFGEDLLDYLPAEILLTLIKTESLKRFGDQTVYFYKDMGETHLVGQDYHTYLYSIPKVLYKWFKRSDTQSDLIQQIHALPIEESYKNLLCHEYHALNNLREAKAKAKAESNKKWQEHFWRKAQEKNHSESSHRRTKPESSQSNSEKYGIITVIEKRDQDSCLKILELDLLIAHSKDALTKSFKRLRFKYHPDKNEDKEAAAEKFKQVYKAYEKISDLLNRYDLEATVI